MTGYLRRTSSVLIWGVFWALGMFLQSAGGMGVQAQGALAGDANGDCKVDGVDFVMLFNHYGLTVSGGASVGDFSGDGKVDGVDFVILFNHYGQVCQGTPVPTFGPSPTQPPTGSAYRAFTAGSYWNTPFPANAPIDSRSATYIADSQNSNHTQNYLRFTAAPGTTQAFGHPIYWASNNDPMYTITPSTYGKTIQAKIPRGATPASGSDGALIVYDLAGNVVIELWQAKYDSNTDKWAAASTKRYYLDSNGLDGSVVGSDNSGNFGNRGIPSSARAVRVDEIKAGAINHRLECFWWATGTQTVGHYWPMSGDEGAKGGIVPEGIVIRIKPSVNLNTRGLSAPALVVAKALQNYGCMVGDNSGSGNRLGLELNETAWRNLGLTYDALSPIPWSDWEFVQGGYRP